jgi:hypothetical protein
LFIGAKGPLGRFLIRGEEGHDFIPELYPQTGEIVIDKPMRSAFQWTDLDLILRNKGIKNLIVRFTFLIEFTETILWIICYRLCTGKHL